MSEKIRKQLVLAEQYAHAGSYADAQKVLRKAIDKARANIDAWMLLGQVCGLQNAHADAEQAFAQAARLDPRLADAHAYLGLARMHQAKHEQAISAFKAALDIQPNMVMALANLIAVLHQLDRQSEALPYQERWLAAEPLGSGAHYNAAVLHQSLQQLQAARKHYEKVLELGAAGVSVYSTHLNLGVVCHELHDYAAAVAHGRQALARKPDCAVSHFNIGIALKEQGKHEEAVASFEKALKFNPAFADAYSNILFIWAYQALHNPQEYLSMARGWEQACVPAHDRQLAQGKVFRRSPLAGRRLRVGYVSGDYSHHAASYFVEQLFAHHDRARVELFAYSSHGKQDAVTERLQALVDHWIIVMGMPDAGVLDRIESDGIDVLVDLSGHTAFNSLGVFARRAAPVQAHYLGYFASTGLTEMDYWIGDEILTPPAMDSHFSEQVWRLPRVWVSYEGKAEAPLTDWHPAQDGSVWVGSFNNLGKLTPETLALWARVLHALPEGKLLLKSKELADAGNQRRIRDAMAGHGILPDRIELQDSRITPNWKEHMAYYDRLDIALDPVGGVGGGTTTCDALWMGAPVIAREGDRMASRMTASMLNAIGHPEWIARSETEYVDKVVALARGVEQRKMLRSSQRNRMASSPLCDARGLATCLEDAYFKMFERWLDQEN